MSLPLLIVQNEAHEGACAPITRLASVVAAYSPILTRWPDRIDVWRTP